MFPFMGGVIGAFAGYAAGAMWWAVAVIAEWPTPTDAQVNACAVIGMAALAIVGLGLSALD